MYLKTHYNICLVLIMLLFCSCDPLYRATIRNSGYDSLSIFCYDLDSLGNLKAVNLYDFQHSEKIITDTLLHRTIILQKGEFCLSSSIGSFHKESLLSANSKLCIIHKKDTLDIFSRDELYEAIKPKFYFLGLGVGIGKTY